VLWELGIEPARSRADALERLLHDGIAYAPIDVLAPGFAPRVATREEALGRPLLPTLAALLDPFGGDGFHVIGATDEEELAAFRAWIDAAYTCSGTGGRSPIRTNRGWNT
jgi:anthranilate phosphoribosyltransferase